MTVIAARDRPLRILLFCLAGIVLAHVLDHWAFQDLRLDGIYAEDWGRFLRIQGFLPTWIVAGIALMLHDRDRGWARARGRGGLLIAGATMGGIAAELLKLLFRRLRPGEFGEYVFRPFDERTFSTGGLGLPSSHALVAFGAAAVLARLFPRARLLWWGLAWGCGLTRVAAGAHFLSDVVVAACVGWLVGAWVWSWAPHKVAAADAEGPVEARRRRRFGRGVGDVFEPTN